MVGRQYCLAAHRRAALMPRDRPAGLSACQHGRNPGCNPTPLHSPLCPGDWPQVGAEPVFVDVTEGLGDRIWRDLALANWIIGAGSCC